MRDDLSRRVLTSATAIIAATFGAQNGLAQDATNEPPVLANPTGDAVQPAAEEPGAQATQIIVTGSRIRATGMISPTPVTAVSAETINQMAPGDVTKALDRLPAFVNSASTADDASSGVSDASGTNLNLRGLGTNRTLTLLNSRRVVPNNKEGTVNIDIFPTGVVERVDIVTGGASAAYGTDAVAGVVNFILNTDYTGLKGFAQAGVTTRGDNESYSAGLTFGTPVGERVHVILSGEYSHESGIEDWEDRRWHNGWSEMTNPEWVATGTGPRNITASNVVGTNFTCGGLISAPGTSIDRLEFLPGGAFAPFVQSPVSVVGPGTNNAQSLATGGGSGCDAARLSEGDFPAITADQERARLYSHLTFDASENIEFFAEGIFSHDQSNFGPSAATMVPPWNATIFSGNPFLPASIQAAMLQENIQSFSFNTELSDLFPENNTVLRNRTFQVTGGVDISLDGTGFLEDWNLAAYYSYGENRQRVEFFGKMRQDRIYIAADAVTDPATGQIVCRAALLNPERFGDCVPINLFGEGQQTLAAVDYVTSPTPGEADVVTFFYNLAQQNGEAVLSGNVWEGWGAGPISLAVGAGYREQSLKSRETGLGASFDTPRNGDLGVRGLPPSVSGDPDIHQFDSFSAVSGDFNVKEAFAELNVPVIVDAPLMRNVTVNGAVRWADYSGSGTVWAYKAGLDWEVVDGVRFRGTYSRDVRAASLSEQFDTQRTNGRINNDPVTGQSYNFSQTTGGNPNVEPEKATTWTAGAVLQPDFIPGFAVSADYWNVEISDAIGQLGPQRIVEECFAGATSLCDLITRAPSGLITDLQNIFININSEKAAGVDFELDYRAPFSLFSDDDQLSLRGFASWLLERSVLIPGAPEDDLLGEYATTSAGDFFSYPELQATANLSYENGPVTIFIQERYISGGKRRNDYVEGVDVDENDVSSVFYTDLGISFGMETDSGRSWELFGFVTNLFDRDPPLAPQPFAALGGSVPTNRQLYDIRGSRVLVGARFELP